MFCFSAASNARVLWLGFRRYKRLLEFCLQGDTYLLLLMLCLMFCGIRMVKSLARVLGNSEAMVRSWVDFFFVSRSEEFFCLKNREFLFFFENLFLFYFFLKKKSTLEVRYCLKEQSDFKDSFFV